jgi:hypothetical protein
MFAKNMIRRLIALVTGGAAATTIAASPPQVTPSPDKIYPYVVSKEYLSHGAPQPDGITRPLGHDLYIVLVHDLDGMVRNVLPDDLKTLGLTPSEAQAKADANLGTLISTQTVKSTVFPSGPQGKPFALFGGHWAAASAATWTGLYGALSKALGSETLVVSIPHREAMLIFREGDSSYIQAMKTMIRDKEADGKKPLTWELFTLTKDGIKPQK